MTTYNVKFEIDGKDHTEIIEADNRDVATARALREVIHTYPLSDRIEIVSTSEALKSFRVHYTNGESYITSAAAGTTAKVLEAYLKQDGGRVVEEIYGVEIVRYIDRVEEL